MSYSKFLSDKFRVKNKKYADIENLIFSQKYEEAKNLLEIFMYEYPNDKYAEFKYALCKIELGEKDGMELMLNLKDEKCKVQKSVYVYLIKKYSINNMRDEADKLSKEAELRGIDIGIYKVINEASRMEKNNDHVNIDNLFKQVDVNNLDNRDQDYLYTEKIKYYNDNYFVKNKKDIEKKLLTILKNSQNSNSASLCYRSRCLLNRLYYVNEDYQACFDFGINFDLERLSIDELISLYNSAIKLYKFDKAREIKDLLMKIEEETPNEMSKVKINFCFKNYEKIIEIVDNTNLNDKLLKYKVISLKRTRQYDLLVETVLNNFDFENLTAQQHYETLRNYIDTLIHLERYEEAYKYTRLYESGLKNKISNQMSVEVFEAYLTKKLNKPYYPKIYTYLLEQIRSYSLEKAMLHVKEHQNIDFFDKKTTYLNENIDLKKLFKEVIPYLTFDNLVECGTTDNYVFEYSGSLFPTNVNLEVCTVGGTKNILSIYPSVKEEVSFKKQVKQLSQIEKFNKKYGNFLNNSKE